MSAPTPSVSGGAVGSGSDRSTGVLPSVLAFAPVLLTANLRLDHRFDSSVAVESWMRNTYVQLTHDGGAVPMGREGDIVLGTLHPPKAGRPPLRIQDHRGQPHLLHSDQAPIRMLTVVGGRESSTHCCGGIFTTPPSLSFDPPPATSSDPEIPLERGARLAWLGEEGGLVGKLLSDAPAHVVIGARDNGELEFAAQAADFVLDGLVFDAATSHPLNIRSLCPPIPRSLTVIDPNSPQSSAAAIAAANRALPKLLLIASTSSSSGKTTLACSFILALHELAIEEGRAAPRIAYVKMTGSGGARELARLRALKNARGQPAVCRAYDHVDVGLVTTYGQQATGLRFKAAVNDMLALASAPCPPVPTVAATMPSRTRSIGGSTPRTGNNTPRANDTHTAHPLASPTVSPAGLLPPELVVCELGSDLIWASNPVLLSMSAVQSRLLSLCLLTTDALSILGACGYLHGTLRFPPQKLHLFCSHTKNYRAMLARIRGSDVQLREHTAQQVKRTLHAMLQTEQAGQPQPRGAQEQSAGQSADLPAARPPSAPSSDSSETALANGAGAVAPAAPSSDASPPQPPPQGWVAPVKSNSVASALDTTPRALAIAVEALQWVEKSFTPVSLPAAPILAHTPALSMLWLALVEWSLRCTELMAQRPPNASAGGAGSTDGALTTTDSAADVSTSPSDPFAWDESDVAAIVLRVSRSERLQRSLAYMSLVRRRNKLRAQQEREAVESARLQLESSLGMLAGAKAGPVQPVKKLASTGTPIVTPGGASPALGLSTPGTGSSVTQLLLALPDWSHSPYALPLAPVAPADSVPASLLSFDAGLATLRRVTVPARVQEGAFWDCLWAHLLDEVGAYLAHCKRNSCEQLSSEYH